MEELGHYIHEMLADDITKMVFSVPRTSEVPYRKIIIWKKEVYFQVESFTEKQAFHENIEKEQLEEKITEILTGMFRQLNGWGKSREYSIKFSKKDKILFHAGVAKSKLPQMELHNRKKQYLLEEGTIIAPLVDMGIFTQEGKVVHSMYDKYKQINRFIEIIDDVMARYEKEDINIVDFGCGKSYLTFIAYYYFTEIKKRKVNITGLDLKADVIEKCNAAAKKYGYENLVFQVGDINGYQPKEPVDMVISLHACDTATDYALWNAIEWDSKIIISVPCCQHEVAKQWHSEEIAIFERYGIVKERVAAAMTDAVRGNLLTACGYKTQLLEFVDLAHTPKNILIRCVKSNIGKEQRKQVLEEAEALISSFHLKPTLYQLLEKNARLKRDI